jgi:hypothetical protein
MKKTCGECGASFECGRGAPGCWCEDFTISRATLEQIAARGDECLCRRCLAAYAERDEA